MMTSPNSTGWNNDDITSLNSARAEPMMTSLNRSVETMMTSLNSTGWNNNDITKQYVKFIYHPSQKCKIKLNKEKAEPAKYVF